MADAAGLGETPVKKRMVIRLDDLDVLKFTATNVSYLTAMRTVQHPFLLAKSRQQVRDVGRERGYIYTLRKVVRKDGFLGLYRGLPISLSGVSTSLIYMYILEKTRSELSSIFGDGVLPSLAAGTIASAASIISAPIDMVTQRTMLGGTRLLSEDKSVRSPEGARNVARAILDRYGPRGFFFGSSISVTMTACWSGIWWGTYALVSPTLLRAWGNARDAEVGKDGAGKDLEIFEGTGAVVARVVSGVVSGTVSAVATAPLDLARTRIQVLTNMEGSGSTGPRAAFVIIKSTIARYGVRGLFRGLGARLTAVVPVSGFLAEFYDSTKRNSLKTNQQH